MQDRGVIADTKTSFDSLTQLGTYSIKASGLPKMPEQHYGTLVVSGSAGSGWLSQQFVADTTGNVYTRVFSNNAWSAWKQGGSQDAINQVKQTADSNSATIRNVQGDVSTLKQTATGIKSTLASHEGDIHTLQADSKSLKDSMTNAQGDISTLSKTATSLDSEMKDHAGRLSKVEQNAATQATTLSDLQGNLSQVKQQADGLVTTLKDAQGSITQIQQKADGTLEQLKSAQGDITSLQTDVTGIKATLTSHEGDIHTLQADSKSLHDNMKDAQGNISSLQKTATLLDSEFKDHDGRLSKVEQTASTLTNEFSDQQDHLNRVEQTAQGTQQTVSNQQGQINTIKTDAVGMHQTLTGQGDQIANINVTLSGLNSKYEGVSGDLGKLKDQVTTNSTQITQNKQAIALKADQSTVNSLSGEVSQNKAQLQVQADQISSKVSSEDFKTLDNKVNNLQVGGDNLISDGDASAFNATPWVNTNFGKHEFYYNGTKNMFVIATSAKKELNSGSNWFPVKAGQQYTLYFNGFMSINVSSYDVLLLGKPANQGGDWSDVYQIITGQRLSPSKNCIVTKTFTVPNFWNNYVAYIRFDNNGSTDGQNSLFFFNEISLKEGNVNTGYSASPNDAITLIKKNVTAIDQTNKAIMLKADQTEVDNVKNTSQQLSSRLDVMADRIKSKVTSTDVNDIINGKGFATQNTVQSLIDQKSDKISESIVKLSGEVTNNGGGINLLKATDFANTDMDTLRKYWGSSFTIRDGVALQVDGLALKSGCSDAMQIVQVEPDTDYTLSFEVHHNTIADGGNWNKIQTFLREFKDSATNKTTDKYADNARSVVNTNKRNDNIQTIHTQPDCHYIRVIFRANPKVLFSFFKPKLERGNAATPYSQAPSDNASVSQLQSVTASIDGLQSKVRNKVDQSQYTQLAGVVQTKVSQSDFNRLNNQVNVQTLDNANIDNMKTTGHYFVHNLTGNPFGGWVYVDVTGNANDRIRQDVYQDSGTKHAFRRWFGTYWTEWSTGAEESEITQLRSDINLRVKSGDLLSQINIAAGHTLIQSNKIYFDADSFVMSPNSKAFIPSAYITNINADKITTGTLDAAKFNVKNFSADNIVGGTLNGVVVKAGTNDRYFQTSKDNIYWVRKGSMSLVGNDTYLNSANGLNIADMNNIQLTTWGGASVNPDGSIVNTSGNAGHPKIVVDTNGNWDPDDPYGTKWGGGPGDSEIAQWVGSKEYTVLTRGKGLTVRLNDENKNSVFVIQKDNKIGFYVGGGDDGNAVDLTTAGSNNRIAFNTNNFDIDGEVSIKNDHGLTAKNVHVTGWLGVDGSKNSIVRTSQGTVAINAYETAEYYFGDIGEGQTGADGIAYIGIEKLFNETVNTTIPYQVFLTAYGSGNLWVAQREHDRFMVKSDQPNIKFGWEIKAKRKGYEHTRLQNVDNKLNNMEATS